jgi:membrane dipeptidase
MKSPALFLILSVAIPSAVTGQDAHMETARRVLTTTPLIDGHNDLPGIIRSTAARDVEAYDLTKRTSGQTDLERLRLGMVGGQFWSVYAPASTMEGGGAATALLEQIDIALQVFEKYPSYFEQAYTAADVMRAFQHGKVASLMGIEGGHAIENSLGALRSFFRMGVRYMTLSHHLSVDWAESWADEALQGGLTPFGKEVVREMNRLGMLVDLSHTSAHTMKDALDVSEAPVIFSHSNARTITDHGRNVPDDVLRRLPTNGGIVMATFVTRYTSNTVLLHHARQDEQLAALQARHPADPERVEREIETWRQANPLPRALLSEVADHIEHIRRVAGIDHVGIGGDFDGILWVVQGLEDVSTYPVLFAELSRRGWTESDLRKLAGENILRVMREVEQVARRLQRERNPSTATFEQLDSLPRASQR